MALHFERSEFDARRDRLMIEMAEKKLDAIVAILRRLSPADPSPLNATAMSSSASHS